MDMSLVNSHHDVQRRERQSNYSERDNSEIVQVCAMEELLVYGLKYIFPLHFPSLLHFVMVLLKLMAKVAQGRKKTVSSLCIAFFILAGVCKTKRLADQEEIPVLPLLQSMKFMGRSVLFRLRLVVCRYSLGNS